MSTKLIAEIRRWSSPDKILHQKRVTFPWANHPTQNIRNQCNRIPRNINFSISKTRKFRILEVTPQNRKISTKLIVEIRLWSSPDKILHQKRITFFRPSDENHTKSICSYIKKYLLFNIQDKNPESWKLHPKAAKFPQNWSWKFDCEARLTKSCIKNESRVLVQTIR